MLMILQSREGRRVQEAWKRWGLEDMRDMRHMRGIMRGIMRGMREMRMGKVEPWIPAR